MAWLKQLLAFPLYGTVAWLVWVLIQEVGPDGALAALFGLVLVGFAVWIYGTTRLAGPEMRRVGVGLAAAGTAAALLLAVTATPSIARPDKTAAQGGLGYEPFSLARLEALTNERRPVFVNLIHDVDLFRYLFGEVEAVHAMESQAVRNHAVEDTAEGAYLSRA